jgi:hypothetical protein
MALYTQATDLQTRETIWVSTNVIKGRPQLNSHRDDDFGRCYQREQIDGFPAWELAGLHSDYVGNGWEAKYMEFIDKWTDEVYTNPATL